VSFFAFFAFTAIVEVMESCTICEEGGASIVKVRSIDGILETLICKRCAYHLVTIIV